tara:strand:+ start:34 stop:297 length:264 start_codon:yes stop_codon:yes gene_type:complete
MSPDQGRKMSKYYREIEGGDFESFGLLRFMKAYFLPLNNSKTKLVAPAMMQQKRWGIVLFIDTFLNSWIDHIDRYSIALINLISNRS